MNKSRKVNPIFYLLISIVLYGAISCKNENKSNKEFASPYFSPLFKANNAFVYRNAMFGYSVDEIKKSETAKLYDATVDHLFYEFSFPKDSTLFSEYANVNYFFDENNQLDIITTDVFLSDSAQVDALSTALNEHFTALYGNKIETDVEKPFWNGSIRNKENKEINYTISYSTLSDDIGISIEFVRK